MKEKTAWRTYRIEFRFGCRNSISDRAFFLMPKSYGTEFRLDVEKSYRKSYVLISEIEAKREPSFRLMPKFVYTEPIFGPDTENRNAFRYNIVSNVFLLVDIEKIIETNFVSISKFDRSNFTFMIPNIVLKPSFVKKSKVVPNRILSKNRKSYRAEFFFVFVSKSVVELRLVVLSKKAHPTDIHLDIKN